MTVPRDHDLERVRQELDELLHARLDAGLCGCPCGKPFPNRPARKRYLNERHRDRAYRERVEALAKARGVSVRQTLRTLDPGEDTAERRADAQAERRRPRRAPRTGVSVYLPSVDVADAALELVAGALACLKRGGEPPGALAADEHRDELELAREAIAKALERRRRRSGT